MTLPWAMARLVEMGWSTQEVGDFGGLVSAAYHLLVEYLVGWSLVGCWLAFQSLKYLLTVVILLIE